MSDLFVLFVASHVLAAAACAVAASVWVIQSCRDCVSARELCRQSAAVSLTAMRDTSTASQQAGC